jgi:hypothetical protein
MESSIFLSKDKVPTEKELQVALADLYPLWLQVKKDVLGKYPEGKEEWNFPGAKYGWSFRIKDKKRAILYLGPRQNYFLVVFIFGDKAVNAILESSISENFKSELKSAKKYAEGRGIRIEVRDSSPLKDIFKLIDFKLAF